VLKRLHGKGISPPVAILCMQASESLGARARMSNYYIPHGVGLDFLVIFTNGFRERFLHFGSPGIPYKKQCRL